MSLLSTIVRAVRSLRNRRDATRCRKRSGPNLEQLDHRRLLAVTFTGNVTNDFTATTPSVYVSDPTNEQPIIPSIYPSSVFPVSGWAIDQIAVNYDQASDTLSLGFLQPLNGKPGLNGYPGEYPVIAGDATDSGNSGVVDPTVQSIAIANGTSFTVYPSISGNDTFYALLDLSGGTNTANETVFAGIPDQFGGITGYPNASYVVAPAVFSGGTVVVGNAVPEAGAELTANEGTIYRPLDDPRHGALELSITHFSQLYQQITGHALTTSSVIDLGAYAGSTTDDGVGKESFHFQPLTLGNATSPPPPPVVVPVEVFQPTILINPHENRHINTAHYDNVRVTVLSSSSFDSQQINPYSVTLDGARPSAWFSKIQLHDGFYSTTFVFKGTDINLPPVSPSRPSRVRRTPGRTSRAARSSSTATTRSTARPRSPLATGGWRSSAPASRRKARPPRRPPRRSRPPSPRRRRRSRSRSRPAETRRRPFPTRSS